VGKVVAPEGTVPINGALVYLVLAPPPPLNEGLFCNKCFNLNEETPQTTTAPDGTFELMSPKSGSYYLVSQKGSFRRVRALEVTGGEQPVPIELTTMPGVSDATTGDAVPRMAVAVGGFDHIEDTLSQLGVEDYASYEGSAFGGGGGDTAIDLLLDWEKISQYQVVFVPCAGSWFDGDLSNPVFLQNIRDFVSAGGKLYVTDWSYDLINTVFPGVITWLGDTGAVGSAQGSVYDAPAVVNDAGLQAWLESQNITDFTLEANWTTIDEVSSYTAPNELNFPTEFEPTVWVNADVPSQGVRPATVSFQYGCGRVLFSTYHTETSGSAILPQELALLYTVLEVNLCIGTGSF